MWAILFVLSLGLIQSGWFQRIDFQYLLPIYSLIYVFYVLLQKTELNTRHLLALGVLSRVAEVIFIPVLSDDFYRFYWDAMLQIEHNISPYAVIPSEVSDLNTVVYDSLNSKEYYSVYPPILQLLYVIAYALAQGNLWGFQLVLGLEFSVIELALYTFILAEFPEHKKVVSWLIICPLCIIEGIGNLHAEVLLNPLLFWLILAIRQQKSMLSAWWFSCLVAIKLNPALWFLAAFSALKQKRLFVFTTAVLIPSFLVLWLLQTAEFQNVITSFRLYFQTFEFNASVYYLVREIGFWVKGYNIIHSAGPIISFFTLIGILALSVWPKLSIEQRLLWSYALFLAGSTTLHPWYFIPFVALLIINQYNWSSIVVSLAVFLSYSAYSATGVHENYWVIGLEYFLIVGSIVLENRKLNSTARSVN